MYDELVKRLRSQCRGYGKECEDCNADGNCRSQMENEAADAIENTSKAYQMMAEAYEAEVTKPRWIPVSERLPEIGEYILVYLFNRSPYIAWIDRTGQWQTEEFWLDAEAAPKAWMPLPEPYEPPKEET